MSLNQTAWFLKYQPKEVDEYVFNNEQQEKDILEWIENRSIPGNLLLFGPAGCGKTSLAELLIRKLIEKNTNVKVIKSRSVGEIDQLYTWIGRKPSKPDNKKIIYIEEFDRLSIQAMNQLKDTLLEKFQEHVSFVACTNHINKIPHPVLTRFTYQYELKSMNEEGTFKRVSDILKLEEVEYNEEDLQEFIKYNYKTGLRTIINSVQINNVNGNINFADINTSSKSEDSIEHKVINLTQKIFEESFKSSPQEKKQICVQPMKSKVNSEYSELIEIIQFSYNIDWEDIYLQLYERINFLPIIQVIEKYLNSLETKKIQHIHFLAFLAEGLETSMRINF